MDDDSSIDGDLEEFLRKNGIDSLAVPPGGSLPEGVYGDPEVDAADLSSYETVEKYSRRSEISGASEAIKLSLPTVLKVSQLLVYNGYDVQTMTAGDVDESKKVSVYVIDEWARSILGCLEEMTVRLETHHAAVKDAKLTSRKVEVSHEALETRVSVLQDKLLEAERKVKASDAKVLRMEEEQARSNKSKKMDSGEVKKAMRGLEEKVEESERRVRQRDLEIERLKERLRQVAEKEKETNVRHREALSNMSRSSPDASFSSSSNTSYSSSVSPSKSSRSVTASATLTSVSRSATASGTRSTALNRGGGVGGGGGISSSATSSRTPSSSVALPIPAMVHDMIQALEAQRDGLEQRVGELEAQVHDLQGALRDQQNGDALFGQRGSARDGSSGSSSYSVSESGTEDFSSSEQATWSSETARSMYDKIKEQSRRIESLSKKCELFKSEAYEAVHAQQQLKSRCDELRDELENLRLELEGRPSARQWADKQRELQDAENKLHDLVMMRGEAAELAAWRKHLSTTDRIKVDKRNHELGLWLLDSLPKAVTKEVLQTVCRELDVSDVSEIQPSIAKLKAVVKAVPRMERFITQVCEYLFERDRHIRELGGRGLAGRERPTMEDVMPVLHSWWMDLQANFNLVSFQNRILTEMRRRERLLAQEGPAASAAVLLFEDTSSDEWPEKEKAASKALELVRDLVDFQVDVFRHKKSFHAAEDFIRDQPDAMVNRQVAHIQYLFSIQHLEGLLPRMNQVYLFTEEMRNFLTSAKTSLGLAAATSDSVAINEVQRVIAVWESEMKG